MLVFVTQRRLKPGTFDQFRKAWEPDEMPQGVRETAYHARSVENPDEILSFGLAYDMQVEDLEQLRQDMTDEERARQSRMSEFVEWTGLEGVYEVIDQVHWGTEIEPGEQAAD